MEIPLVDLRKQYAPLKNEILSGIAEVLDGMHLFLGENVQKLEVDFARYCGVAHGIGVSDGTTALSIIRSCPLPSTTPPQASRSRELYRGWRM